MTGLRELADKPGRVASRRPLLDQYLEEMPDELREIALTVLRDARNYSATRVANSLTAEGYPISANPIHNWRRENVA